MSEDVLLTLGAALVELGAPGALAIAWCKRPQLRRRVIVVLGSVTPILAFYAFVSAAYLIASNQDTVWSFYAMWIMSLLPYLSCAILGVALSFIPRPTRPAPRYLMGFVSPLMVWGIVIAWH